MYVSLWRTPPPSSGWLTPLPDDNVMDGWGRSAFTLSVLVLLRKLNSFSTLPKVEFKEKSMMPPCKSTLATIPNWNHNFRLSLPHLVPIFVSTLWPVPVEEKRMRFSVGSDRSAKENLSWKWQARKSVLIASHPLESHAWRSTNVWHFVHFSQL